VIKKMSNPEHIMNKALMIGVNNRAWVPCMYQTADAATSIRGYDMRVANWNATDNWLYFYLPLPTSKGNLKLYVDAVRVGLRDADANDYVTHTGVRAIPSTGALGVIHSDDTDLNAPGEFDQTFTAYDCSAYNIIGVILGTVVSTALDLEMIVLLRCYYDV